MPTKHVVKNYDAPAFYHVYNRASGERLLFRDTADRLVFLALLQKHILENNDPDEPTRLYPVDIVAYCLMGTHFHLLLFQRDNPHTISGFMRSVGTAYSMYYNQRYKSKGHVFQSSFRASHISNESYLAHITRYIHLNPRNYETWKWSSYPEYTGRRQTDWLRSDLVLQPDEIGERYRQFVASYADTDRRAQTSSLADLLAS